MNTLNPQAIANWIIDNPGRLYELAMLIAEKDFELARRLAWDCDGASDYYDPESYDNTDDDPDCDDGDALASAGYGTDEDYGGGCDHI